MISPAFYQEDNVAQVYQGGLVRHYLHKPRTVTIKDRPTTLVYGETLYSKAAELFGDENEFLWTILADNMPVRHPDAWGTDDLLKLPVIVLNDYNPPKNRYGAESTATTAIPR